MSKELHIALQNAIGDLGTDVLKSPFLVNILQDYGAFDVHDKHSLVIKQRLAELVNDRLVEEIVSWEKLSDKKVQSNALSLLKRYNDDNDVRYIIDSTLKACGLPPLTNPSSPASQTKPSKTPQPATAAPNIITPQVQPTISEEKFSGKNIGCALFGLLVFLPCGLILLSMREIGGGLVCLFGAIISIIGPFVNPDFWKWNGY